MDRTATLCVCACAKGHEQYVVVFTPATRALALRQLGLWAENPDLSFTWYDAAVAAKRIRAGAQCQ